MKNIKKTTLLFLMIGVVFSSCNYLDVIPDNIATLDYAFADETTTERYLLTCYGGMPVEGSLWQDPAYLASDEFFTRKELLTEPGYGGMIPFYDIARGRQNVNEPCNNMYEGRNAGINLWQTIRKCFIFQNNVDKVQNLGELKKKQWVAESKCIMAYCYYTLLKMYGPVPIIDKEFDIDSEVGVIRIPRSSFDECSDFVANLLDEACVSLPQKTYDRQQELGRFNQCIALSLKAKMRVMAASPLFNGNPYLQDWTNVDGKRLVSDYNPKKWNLAMEACAAAIKMCEKVGNKLYTYPVMGDISVGRYIDHTFRSVITDREWGGTEGSELVWGSVMANTAQLQGFSMPRLVEANIALGGNSIMFTCLNVTSKIVNLFYTSNGIPIEEDPEWSDKNTASLQTPQKEAVMYVTQDGRKALETDFISEEENTQIPTLLYNREPRFYGSVGFNRCKWYANGKTGEESHIVRIYRGELANRTGSTLWWPATGYFARKLSNLNTTLSKTTFQATVYPFPIIRLADLYLLYAECANEVNGPSEDTKHYLNLVRKRAGLAGVDESWAKSTNPNKPQTKDGLREIIQTERMIELSFEGKRFWDLRRWLKLEAMANEPVSGCNMRGEIPEDYWSDTFFYKPSYTKKDYLWPLRTYALNINPNLVQAKGW